MLSQACRIASAGCFAAWVVKNLITQHAARNDVRKRVIVIASAGYFTGQKTAASSLRAAIRFLHQQGHLTAKQTPVISYMVLHQYCMLHCIVTNP